MRNSFYIACGVIATWACAGAALGQALNPALSYYGQGNQLGSATFNDTYRSGPSGAPIGIGQTGLPASGNTGRVPGANLDLINGSISTSSTMGGAGAPGAAINPALTSGVSLGTGSGLSVLGSHPGGVFGATGGVGLQKPGAEGSATQPGSSEKAADLGTILAARSHDALYLKAAEKFNHAQYKDCAELLKPVMQNHQGSLEVRQLYIAALVSLSRVYTAAYEAKLAAQAYPKVFFTDDSLVLIYKENPDFTVHFGAVEAMCKNSTNPELGILWAMYQRLDGSEKNDAALTLSLLDVKASDQAWFGVLKDGLKTGEAAK